MTWEHKGPLLAVDALILYPQDRFVAIERKFPPYGFALPGGFVDTGETLEHAVVREVKEETSLELQTAPVLLTTCSDPDRDPRRHVVSIVYKCFPKDLTKLPIAGDDAKECHLVSFGEIDKYEWCFDHKDIINNFLRQQGNK